MILKGHQDDYNRILSLFPSFDSTLAKSYEKNIEEAIKMASISITRHPNSKWVDDAYILIGKARLYSLDWGNAIQTFKYVNTKSKDPDARHRAIIHLIRTFTVHKEYLNAEAAIDYLKKEEKMSNRNKKDFLLEKAYFHQIQGDYDNMVRSLAEAAPLIGKNDRRGRLYFIVGQVYQELGFEAEAFNFYRRCLATNPEYETDFYARLYMAQVAVISRSKDVNTARKSFRRLLKDSKNREFKDKIYYEMGTFERKQKNLPQAITDFNLAIREGTNRRIDGEAYLQLGEMYYDTLKNYKLSQAYYDSAIGALPRDHENYAAIKARQEILNEFVTHLNTIQWQDSLLRLSYLDSVAVLAIVDSAVTAQKKLDEQKSKGVKKKKKAARVELQSNEVNVFSSGEATDETGNWYFGNSSAVSLGQTEFRRTWGEVKLEDNWRRSTRATTVGRTQPLATTTPGEVDAGVDAVKEAAADPVKEAFTKLSAEIPSTDEARNEALGKIESAYFRLGDIYYFNLLEKKNALAYYNKLLDRFPDSELAAEAHYKIYLILKEQNDPDAQRYATLLSQKFPESTFAKILLNPDYLKVASQTVDKQEALYASAYELYRQDKFVQSRNVLNEALNLGQTDFTPNLELLGILLLAKTDGLTAYQEGLRKFLADYPESDLNNYARGLLESSEKYSASGKRDNASLYTEDPEARHYFIIAYERKSKIGDVASRILEEVNKTSYREQRLKTSNLVLNDQYTITMVSDFPESTSAMKYFGDMKAKLPTLPQLRGENFRIFIISQDNFNIFYRTKTLTEYLTFFSIHYGADPQ